METKIGCFSCWFDVVFKDTQWGGVGPGWVALLGSFCAEHFLSIDWGSEKQQGTTISVFFWDDVQLWDGWGKNENRKPSQESYVF